MTWNAVGKPDSVTVGAGTQRNVYDASGGLLLQVEPDGSATLFNGDTELHVAAGSSTVTAVRTYASPDGVPVAERTTAAGVTGSKLFWVSANVDGSVDVEIDAGSGTVSRRYTDPYGNARGPAVSWSDAHGFLNKPVSAATGLTTVGARLYDPLLGRFVSVDSVLAPTNPQQNNGYSYSANNPVTLADPSGDCYDVGSDSLSFRTNCVGSAGSAAGNGAAAAPGGGPSSTGASSSNYRPPAAKSGHDDQRMLQKGPDGTITGNTDFLTYGNGNNWNLKQGQMVDWNGVGGAILDGANVGMWVVGVGVGVFLCFATDGACVLVLTASGVKTVAGETAVLDFDGSLALARAKLPEGWGEGIPNNKGVGVRWMPNKSDGVRIDQGDPLNSQLTQQIDHVVVRSGGKVIGRDGLPMPPGTSIKDAPDLAHIPLDEWLRRKAWNTK